MDEVLLICFFLTTLGSWWLSLALIGCGKKKPGVKKVGQSACSVPVAAGGTKPGQTPSPASNVAKPAPTPSGGNPSPDPKASDPNADAKANNKDKDEKKPDDKPEEKKEEDKKEDDGKKDGEEKKEEEKKSSKKEKDEPKKKESSNHEDKKKSEKPKDGGGGGEKKEGAVSGAEVKQSLKPELSTNRTQPSKSIKVKDDDDTVKHIESLKEDKEKSE